MKKCHFKRKRLHICLHATFHLILEQLGMLTLLRLAKLHRAVSDHSVMLFMNPWCVCGVLLLVMVK